MINLADPRVRVVLRYPDGRYVDLDRDSGGYPYGVSTFRHAHAFTLKDGLAYNEHTYFGEKRHFTVHAFIPEELEEAFLAFSEVVKPEQM